MHKFKILPKTVIFSNLLCYSKKRLFEELAECAGYVFRTETQTIINALNHREQYGSTIVTEGLAMPVALVRDANEPLAILAILSKEIAFNTVDTDKQKVDIVFSFYLSENDDLGKYEIMLEKLTEIMSNQDLLSALRKVKHDENKVSLILHRVDALLQEALSDKEV